ncbi:MAG: SDR family NAD(P)-dependent oxidoreductase [Acidimicrobiia bacterium]|nr:SDR family NAD(P)-dependent oxidoreductase [Acidimicrobiia bacterium]
MEDLAGRTAVVTGGASGIGLATSRLFAAEGMNVVLADMEASALDGAVAEVAAGGSAVEGVVCDVSRKADVDALAERAYERFGAVHIVFNNAGVAVGGPTAEMTHADWQWLVDVNLWGPIHGIEAFVAPMVAAGEGGHVLFTASFAGLAPNVGLGPYCVTKYGVVAMAEVLQKELRGNGIGVSVLCPMRVATNIGRSERNRQDAYGGPEASHPVEAQGDDNPNQAGRVLDVEDVAAEVLDAVRRNRLYIVPHAESRRFVENRFNRIMAAYEP